MRRLRAWLGAAFLFSGLAFLAGARRFTRVAVSGHSMEPVLCDGDWLLVDRSPLHVGRGDVVVAWDPRARDRLIVKRVALVGTDSELLLSSDHPAHADEKIPQIAPIDVVGRARLICWPPRRVGPIN